MICIFSTRRLLPPVTAIIWVAMVGCGIGEVEEPVDGGTNPGGGAAQVQNETPIYRQEAIDRAVRYLSEPPGLGRRDGPSEVTNITGITSRFMSIGAYEAIQGHGAGYVSAGYGSSGPVWVVQVSGDSGHILRTGNTREYRYATVSVHAYTGGIGGETRTRAEPTFISAEINEPSMNELVPVENPLADTKISREEVRNFVETNFSGYSSSLLERMEIDLVESPSDGIVWWVYIPRELGSGCGASGGPGVDGRHLWCLGAAQWMFVDADTGEISDGKNFGKSALMVTNEEVQALRRFAWEEGWWELWHQLKPYTDRTLPEGFAASLDRPNAPTPTPGPPTPTPDPNLPPTPTPTPAPSSLRRGDDWIPESPSTSINKTYEIGMAIKTPEDM